MGIRASVEPLRRFDVEIKADLPLEHVLLQSIGVRGDLGHVGRVLTSAAPCLHTELKFKFMERKMDS